MDNQSKQIDAGAAIKWGWETLKKDFWYFVLLMAIVIIIPNIFNGTNPKSATNFFWNIISLLLSTWLTCGITKILLDYLRGKKDEMSLIFTYIKPFGNVLLANILLTIIIGIGFVLLIIPGIYLALKYMFTVYLIIDKDMGVMDAMKKSANMTEGIKLELFLFGLIALGVILLGLIALGIGIFVAVPVIYLAFTFIYFQLNGEGIKGLNTNANPAESAPKQ